MTSKPTSSSTNINTSNTPSQTKPPKTCIIELSKFVDKEIRVKFQGGREAKGKLKGYDQYLNLVLDETVEYSQKDDSSRKLGLTVCRGPAVTVICPQDGHEPIANPFVTS